MADLALISADRSTTALVAGERFDAADPRRCGAVKHLQCQLIAEED